MKLTWLMPSLAIIMSSGVGGCHRAAQDGEPIFVEPAALASPQRKPGLWRQTMTVGQGADVHTSNLCVDAATDARISWWGRAGFRENCTQNDLAKQDDGTWRLASDCAAPGNLRTQTSGLITGDFERRYQLRAQVRISNAPVPDLNGSNTIVLDGEWVGQCPSGMSAGEMQLPSGRRLNLLDVEP